MIPIATLRMSDYEVPYVPNPVQRVFYKISKDGVEYSAEMLDSILTGLSNALASHEYKPYRLAKSEGEAEREILKKSGFTITGEIMDPNMESYHKAAAEREIEVKNRKADYKRDCFKMAGLVEGSVVSEYLWKTAEYLSENVIDREYECCYEIEQWLRFLKEVHDVH